MTAINEIKQRIDIVELVSDYVPLQKAGRNFKGLCPFHSEKHPSFFVFPEQQTWHCFGACGTGGDVFSFIMKKDGIDFSQALSLLAQRAGVTLGSPGMPSKPEDAGKEELYQINEAAAAYYHHLLLNTKVGEGARSYLSKRKILLETIREARLGFSPDSWESIKEYLMAKGYEENKLIEAGLVIEKEGGDSYDRFRNRLLFPICDIQGRVIGFGARAVGESLPKYINSPQTSVFDKGASLYGIDKAKDAIRRENSIIIVEGYMDVLMAHQHGWRNVVASMGTAMTEKQVAIAKKLTKNIVLALDADAAGQEATLRDAEVLISSLDKKTTPIPLWTGLVRYENVLDAEIKVIALPKDEDPDEVIREDPGAWQNLLSQARPLLDFALATVTNKIDTSKAKDKSLAMERLLPLICETKEPVKQAHYVQKLAQLIKVDESLIVVALRKAKGAGKGAGTSLSPVSSQLLSDPVEEYCLALLLQYPELRQIAKEVSADHFQSSDNRELLIRWQDSPDIPTLKDKLDFGLSEHLNYLLGKSFPAPIRDDEKTRRSALIQCSLRLQERLLRRLEARREQVLVLENEAGGVSAQLAKLEEQGIEGSKELKDIFVRQAEHWRKKEA
jgi:DNA primase